MSRPQKPEIITFGCRLNLYESEVMRSLADEPEGETIVINTCAVTNEATRQARQAIRKTRRERPGARIVVTGCAAQIDPSAFGAMDEVDAVIGNAEKLSKPDLRRALTPGGERVVVSDIMGVRETAPHLIDGFAERVRAYVEVQNGCDHRCTFCIIPYGRGPARSVPAGETVNRIRQLVANGTPEIVLSGVDMTSWGHDLPGTPKLGRLVRQILTHVPELKRLRLSSVDPIEIDEELIALFADEDRLMPHVHLSLQAGSDMILKRMKRRHLRADAERLTDRLLALRPDIVFGADLIAGFPTETDEMFAQTGSAIDACNITYAHIFPFSPKEGTPAARMPQLPRAEIKRRAAHLRHLGEAALERYLRSRVGKSETVLAEKPTLGRTEGFAPVALDGRARPGDIIRTRIDAVKSGQLVASAKTTTQNRRQNAHVEI